MSFSSLPVIAKINILSRLPDKEFHRFCSFPELSNICEETPNSEHLYHERSLIFFSNFVALKPTSMKWKDFYNKMMKIERNFNISNNININIIDNNKNKIIDLSKFLVQLYVQKGDMFALSVILFLFPDAINEITSFNAAWTAVDAGSIEMLNWLETIGVLPTQHDLIRVGHTLDVIEPHVQEWLKVRNII